MPDDPLERLGPIEGRASQVSLTLTGLSVRKASSAWRYAYPDFGSDFIHALLGELAGPRRGGLLRSKLVCPTCGSSLDGVAIDRVTVAADVGLSRIPPIHLDLDMPGMECPKCGRRLVAIHDNNVESDLSDALIAAFNRAGVAPG
jgi:ribosomal protein S27AE